MFGQHYKTGNFLRGIFIKQCKLIPYNPNEEDKLNLYKLHIVSQKMLISQNQNKELENLFNLPSNEKIHISTANSF